MNKFIFGFLVILTTALMGSSFAIGKIGLAYTSPMLLAAIWFILAGFIVAIVVKLIKRPHPKKDQGLVQIEYHRFFPDSWCNGMHLCRFKDHFSRGTFDFDIHEPIISGHFWNAIS
ncbi:hypothetical protein [Peribacillus simplex]|uniref:hypothetical protein n=1 Tax=Peribacillus simplex TaxID=1478 RepID=UPI00267996C1